MSTDSRVRLFHPAACELGEGVLWHPVRQSLWWVDILQKRVFESDLSAQAVRSFEVESYVSALMPAAGGDLIATLRDGIHQLDPISGKTRLLAAPPEHDPVTLRFNDAKCDPRGRLFAGTIALDGSKEKARLYRIDADRSTQVVRERVSISNGLAWSPDQRTLYYIDTPTQCVHFFDYDPAIGAIKSRATMDVSSVAGSPDGCTIDTQGRLWIAHWGGSCVSCWDPVTGTHVDTLKLPVSQVTNCTFGGPQLNRLFITSAAIGLSDEQRQTEPLAGHVFVATIDGVCGAAASICAIR